MTDPDRLLDNTLTTAEGHALRLTGQLTERGYVRLAQWLEPVNGPPTRPATVDAEPGDISTLHRALVKRGLIGEYRPADPAVAALVEACERVLSLHGTNTRFWDDVRNALARVQVAGKQGVSDATH